MEQWMLVPNSVPIHKVVAKILSCISETTDQQVEQEERWTDHQTLSDSFSRHPVYEPNIMEIHGNPPEKKKNINQQKKKKYTEHNFAIHPAALICSGLQ